MYFIFAHPLGEENNIILEKEDCDDENDRLYNVKLVGTKIRGLYEGSGWSTGTIKYYNSKIDKYLVEFDDKSTDLIKEEEIDGIEICFVVENKKRKKKWITEHYIMVMILSKKHYYVFNICKCANWAIKRSKC